MSLTQAENVYLAAHETALNDLVGAVCGDRPRLLVYGSPAFVPTTTVQETRMDPIPFPGITGGIEWRVRLTQPLIDLHPQSAGLPPELTLGDGALSIRLGVELCLDCRRQRIGPLDSDRESERTLGEITCCRLEVFAVGGIERIATSAGEDAITFRIEAVEIVDIAPDAVEQLLECLIFMILQAVLATIRIPLRALSVGAFTLTLAVGPLVGNDQVEVRGTS